MTLISPHCCGEGLHELSTYAVDNNTNQETPQSVALHIDLTKPVIEIAYVTNGGIFGPITPNIGITEPNLKSTTITLEGRPYLEGALINTGGSHSLIVTVFDKAGNSESVSVQFTVDVIPPVNTVAFDGDKGNDGVLPAIKSIKDCCLSKVTWRSRDV